MVKARTNSVRAFTMSEVIRNALRGATTGVMSTMRRPLGTGPTSTTRSTTSSSAPRLLPVERVDQEHVLVDVEHEHQEHDPVERRRLGHGCRPPS